MSDAFAMLVAAATPQANKPTKADEAEHHARCEAEYAEPRASIRREFKRRWGFNLPERQP